MTTRQLVVLAVIASICFCSLGIGFAIVLTSNSRTKSMSVAIVNTSTVLPIIPTNTPMPTDTPLPTDTPYPTNTTTPTRTPTATPTATSTDLPKTTTAQAVAIKNKTATAKAIIAQKTREVVRATAAIESYRWNPPKGSWWAYGQGITVGAYDFEYRSSGGGMRIVLLGVRIDNDSKAPISSNPLNCTLVDLGGASYPPSDDMFRIWSNHLPTVEVMPGNHVYGGMTFVIPDDTGPAKFIYRVGIFGPIVEVDLRKPSRILQYSY